MVNTNEDSWEDLLGEFFSFLKIERSLSDNSIEAYLHDANLLHKFAAEELESKAPALITYDDLKTFLKWMDIDNPRTQSRVLSGVRSLFRYMIIEGKIDENPASLMESPRQGRVLPEVLTIKEISKFLRRNPTGSICKRRAIWSIWRSTIQWTSG